MVVSHPANKDSFQVTPSGDDTIVITRLFNAPRQLVFEAQEVRDMVIGSGMEKGAALSYDRLEDLTEELQRS